MARLFPGCLIIICAAGCIFLWQAHGQNSRTGSFDFSKVQKEVSGELVDSLEQDASSPALLKNAHDNDNYFFITLRIIGYLLFLTLIIVLLIWLFRKLGLAGSSRIGGGSMDLLEALPIGQNRSLILVRVMNAVYVLAQTQQQVVLLEKIEGEKAVELIASTRGGTSIMQFKEVFNNFIDKIKKTSS
jgi:flagellar biosynthetic protein FliO